MEAIEEEKPKDCERRYSSLSDAVFHPIDTSFSVLNWVGTAVETGVVNPVANRVSTSLLNPNNLSVLLWNRIKRMTPQRARDVTRIISTATVNLVAMLQSNDGAALRVSQQEFQTATIRAAASPLGREIVLDTISVMSKTADALNTKESKQVVDQAAKVAKSWIQFLASDEGQKMVASGGAMVKQFAEAAASPEANIFLAELGTNICHALEVEFLKSQESQDDDFEGLFPPNIQAENAKRCAAIEKQVLERMGVCSEITNNWQVRKDQTPIDHDSTSDEKDVPTDVVLPDWNEFESRSALRQRHKEHNAHANVPNAQTLKRNEKVESILQQKHSSPDLSPISAKNIQHYLSRLIAIALVWIILFFTLFSLYVIYPRVCRYITQSFVSALEWRNA